MQRNVYSVKLSYGMNVEAATFTEAEEKFRKFVREHPEELKLDTRLVVSYDNLEREVEGK